MSVRLYVGNLPKEVERAELEAVFAGAGELASTKLIVDRKTGKSRGFAFVTVATDEEADRFIEQYNGQTFKEVELKIEKAMPRKGKGDDDEAGEASGNTPAPRINTGSSHGGGGGGHGGGGGGNNNRRRDSNRGGGGGGDHNKSKSRRGGAGGTAVVAESATASAQPDPRWAGELEKLKQLLAAQATN